MPSALPSPTRSIIIHGHFYQPPREDPWLDLIPVQPSAAPYHDWNERIERESYGPITRARVLDPAGERYVNTLEYLSFNFGPTLLVWLERHAPDTYRRILEADARSLARLGHGNAIAQAYHHTILPLATLRDKRTEVTWGIVDFKRRFGRAPDGLWLPETAVDGETLDVVADLGIGFVILAPHQVRPLPPGGAPGRYVTAGGAEIALVPYDGGLSHNVAFGQAARDGARWAERLATVGSTDRRLVVVATDGETYGHHHEFAEMGLAAALHHLSLQQNVTVENAAAFLARHPPTHHVELLAPSSWSCAHGVERWRSDCGCRLDPAADTHQRWKAPLREGLESLASSLHEIFEEQTKGWLKDPWRARDLYVSAVDTGPPGSPDPARVLEVIENELVQPAQDMDSGARLRLAELMEMERNALRMFTSCGWFFDDVARLEPRQILAYAARALELSGASERLRPEFVRHLEQAVSNDADDGNAADLFQSIRGQPQGSSSGSVPRI